MSKSITYLLDSLKPHFIKRKLIKHPVFLIVEISIKVLPLYWEKQRLKAINNIWIVVKLYILNSVLDRSSCHRGSVIVQICLNYKFKDVVGLTLFITPKMQASVLYHAHKLLQTYNMYYVRILISIRIKF